MTSSPSQPPDANTNPATGARPPWPRFTGGPASLVGPPRYPAPHEPWPRWGWFPRSQHAWTFAPSPPLTAFEPPREGVRAKAGLGGLEGASADAGDAPPAASKGTSTASAEAIPEAPPIASEPVLAVPRFVQGLVPARRTVAMALVPARGREIVLADVAKAARRVAPAAAVAGAVAAVAFAFMRRR